MQTEKPRRLTLLLPPWEVLERQGDAAALATLRARGDRHAQDAPGRRAQQLRVFDIVPKPPAWAAITRQVDCGDSAGSLWLRADPAHLRVEAGGLRLLSWGESLVLEAAQAKALAAAVLPVFHALGMTFSAPVPHRWYVQLARGRPIPQFVDPEVALGALGSPLPEGTSGVAEWSRLLNETQMILHDHAVNRRRAQQGLLPVNSLWLWGAGESPLKLQSREADAMISGDDEYGALARLAKVAIVPALGQALASASSAVVVDALRAPRSDALREAMSIHEGRNFETLRLDCADGTVIDYKRWHRLRFWRRQPS